MQTGIAQQVQYIPFNTKSGQQKTKVEFMLNGEHISTLSTMVFQGRETLRDGMRVALTTKQNGNYTNIFVGHDTGVGTATPQSAAPVQQQYPSTSPKPAGGYTKQPYKEDPKKQLSIEVQSATERAIEIFQIMLEHNVLPEGVTKSALGKKGAYHDVLMPVLEQITRDVLNMRERIKNDPKSSVTFPNGEVVADTQMDDDIPF